VKLGQHLKVMHKEPTYDFQCTLCDENFITWPPLVLHQHNRHGKSLDHVCHICGKGYVKSRTLNEHLRTVHDTLKIHKCKDCGKGFSKSLFLKNHLHVHDKNKRRDHLCIYCGAEYAVKHSLIKHIKYFHNNEKREKKYKCEDCGLGFTNMRGLKIHIKAVHQDIYLFPCKHCDRTFKYPSSLGYHEKKNHLKDISCEFCNKTFGGYTALKEHVNFIHKGIKEYSCPVCTQSYVSKFHLKRHIQSKHKEFSIEKPPNM